MPDEAKDLSGLVPESWHCIDCGVNTAPGLLNRVEMERVFAAKQAAGALAVEESIPQEIDDRSEVYTVRESVWRAAGMAPYGGCLCIGCIEQRLGRVLKRKDFMRDHPFNVMPGTPRLRQRQLGTLNQQ
jgi:hypothetical protein